MKKLYLLGGFALALSLSSCLKDGEQKVTQSFNASTLNIITSLEDSDEEAIVSVGYYYFSLDLTERTGNIQASNLVYNNTNYAFTTDDSSFKSPWGTEVYFEQLKGFVKNNSALPLEDASFAALVPNNNTEESGYYYDLTDAAEYTYVINQNNPWLTVGKYKVGNSFKVNTFPVNSFFRGITKTTYPPMPAFDDDGTYTADDIIYRIMIDINEDGKVGNTATIIIYNSKFSGVPMEPRHGPIIVKGLNLEFGPKGISISGENIVPDVVEAGETTPNDKYIFNKINFQTIDSYFTECELTFTVMGIYNGAFTGSYLNCYNLNN